NPGHSEFQSRLVTPPSLESESWSRARARRLPLSRNCTELRGIPGTGLVMTWCVILIIVLLVLAAVAYRATEPEERLALLQIAVDRLEQVKHAATTHRPEDAAFRIFLRGRMRWVLATPALVAANVIVFVLMLASPGAPGDPDTLVRWGAN